MTKQTKTHAIAFSLMSLIGLGAPVASFLANAPSERPMTAQAGIVRAAADLAEIPAPPAPPAPEAAPELVVLDPLMVVGSAPRARKAPPVAGKAQRCHRHELEQGGGPGAARFVQVCVPAG